MLDESLCGYPDAVSAVKDSTADMLNVRLSKCGGIFPSLRIIGLAQRSGLGLQLGCHPGETAILSAAGRHVASRVQGLCWVEGSYDRHILKIERHARRHHLRLRRLGQRRSPGRAWESASTPRRSSAMTTERRDITYD